MLMLTLAACPAYPFFLFILRIHPSYPARIPPAYPSPTIRPMLQPMLLRRSSPAPASLAPLLLHPQLPCSCTEGSQCAGCRARYCCNAAMLLLLLLLRFCYCKAAAAAAAAILLLQSCYCCSTAAMLLLLQCCCCCCSSCCNCCCCCNAQCCNAAIL
jgi:hypothetical protein